jgi:hypothetical protein
MKHTPDTFPIRYAIFVDESFKDENLKDDLLLSRQNALWFQLIQFLESRPLELNDLSLKYNSVSYRDADGNDLCIIPKLEGTKEWADNLNMALEKNVGMSGTFGSPHGSIFNLTAYSYEGMAERPLYKRILNADEKSRERVIAELQLKNLNYFAIEGLQVFLKNKYKQVMTGKANLWKKYGGLNKPEVFFLEMPYSKLWKALDKASVGGIACFNGDLQRVHDAIGKIKDVEYKETIIVAIAKDLEALMLEEIAAEYKTLTLCRNCGKPLPAGSKGVYCPKTLENMDCYRKRDSIRHKKSAFTN